VVRVRQARDHGGERVVVAKLDLRGAHGVVLVDDRNRPVRDQLPQRFLHAKITRAHAQIVMRQEDLRDSEQMRFESRLPDLHQPRLADGGAGLLFRKLPGTPFEFQCAHPQPHGAR
jgi:hypothetical protein